MLIGQNGGRKVFDRIRLRQAWDRTHLEKSVSGQPDEAMVAFVEHLRPRLPPDTLVLDAGCGRGRNTCYLYQTGFEVYGCDLSPVAIEVAKAQMGAAANLQVAVLSHLPYPDGLFAAAVCVHVLPYHFKVDIVKGVRELGRVLRPGGRLYFDLLDRDDAKYGCGKELEEHTFWDPDGVPIHFSSQQEVNDLLNGLALERIERLELGSGSRTRVGWGIWTMKCIDKPEATL